MKCPSCQFEDTKVIDSRINDVKTSIRRRRECEKCGFRFTTFEKAPSSSLMVHKKDGSTEPYDRDKLEKAIMTSFGKRRVSLSRVRQKMSELEDIWSQNQEVHSTQIGEDIVEMLREFDEVAFIRFASVYKEFQDIDTFKQELETI